MSPEGGPTLGEMDPTKTELGYSVYPVLHWWPRPPTIESVSLGRDSKDSSQTLKGRYQCSHCCHSFQFSKDLKRHLYTLHHHLWKDEVQISDYAKRRSQRLKLAHLKASEEEHTTKYDEILLPHTNAKKFNGIKKRWSVRSHLAAAIRGSSTGHKPHLRGCLQRNQIDRCIGQRHEHYWFGQLSKKRGQIYSHDDRTFIDDIPMKGLTSSFLLHLETVPGWLEYGLLPLHGRNQDISLHY